MSALISELINITAHKLHRPLLTIHIMKAYDASYSKIIREHKYKDQDNNKPDDVTTTTKTQTKYLKHPTYAIF